MADHIDPGRSWHGRRGHGSWADQRPAAPVSGFRRHREGRMLGGVATGLASRTRFDVTAVRIGLVLFGLVSGIGIAAYVVAWLLVPMEGEAETIAARAIADRRGLALAALLAPLLVVLLLIGSALDAGWLGSLAWPLFVAGAGLVLIWRNAPDDERALMRRAAEPVAHLGSVGGRSGLGWRVVAGVVLAAGGVATLSVGHEDLVRPLGGVALVLAAFVVVFGPWWLRIGQDLMVERRARLRAEERADMAARVHDSVLQTLAMIQRRADDPAQVAGLARAQERELRAWLFEGRPVGSVPDGVGSLGAAVTALQGEVEARFGVQVEAVVVGDCPLDEDVAALLAAAREAAVNAAKWSGCDVVSLFAEVEPTRVAVFVRDRGRGFDPLAVAADRRGISSSIRDRMVRRGGGAQVRSAPGDGTEVELTMPRPGPAGGGRR